MISGFYVTFKGQNYIARAMSDRTLVFTRGEYGNGIYTGSPMEAESLVNKLGPLHISNKTVLGKEIVVSTQFSNKVDDKILPGFKLTEVGLYGKLNNRDGREDPEAPEVLLFYGYIPENYADYIDAVLTEFLINFPLTISGEANIKVTIDESLVYPTKAEFDEAIGDINKQLATIVTSFIKEDVLVTPDMFSPDETYSEEGYLYKAIIPLEGARPSHIADVFFHPKEANAGLFATIAKAETDQIVIYAEIVPEEEIIIPTIECRNVKGLTGGGSGGDGILGDDDVATDEEAGGIIDDIFGDDEGGTDEPNGDVATDEEVGDIIDDIFGSDDNDDTGGSGEGEDENKEPDGDIATDEEVGDIIDNIFGQ